MTPLFPLLEFGFSRGQSSCALSQVCLSLFEVVFPVVELPSVNFQLS
jgi:hypothetical protein